MRYSELTRRLRRLGIELAKQGARHEVWVDPDRQLRTVIPRHRNEEVPPGTLDRILKDLGLTRNKL